MKNREIAAGWAYHDGTKHSYQSIRTNPHYLDWEIQPIPFKIYREIEPIPLNQHLSSSGVAALMQLRWMRPMWRVSLVPCAKLWRNFFFSRRALPNAGVIRAERCFFAPLLARARSITSISIWSAATSKTSKPGSITSVLRTSPCEDCGKETTGARWSAPPAHSLRS